MKYDDDNIEQVGDDEFIVVNYNEDTVYLLSHVDTTINGHHVVIDTIQKNDTIYIEKTCFEEELKVIEKLIDRPDFGKISAELRPELCRYRRKQRIYIFH